ncbi:hypothetical protein Hanom_Chr03g00230371 [Helianthus anomalus]
MYKDGYTNNQRLNVFTSNFEDILLKYEVNKLESVDIVFVLVLQGDHFYVLCFHMKTDKIELIDNSAIKQDFEERYKVLPDTLVIPKFFIYMLCLCKTTDTMLLYYREGYWFYTYKRPYYNTSYQST